MDVAEEINPALRGWVNYYGRFQRSALHTVFDPLDRYLERWLRRKYKRLKYKVRRARGATPLGYSPTVTGTEQSGHCRSYIA